MSRPGNMSCVIELEETGTVSKYNCLWRHSNPDYQFFNHTPITKQNIEFFTKL